MTTSTCKHCSKNDYESIMSSCVRCDLQKEINMCKTCNINNNKLKKANDIFPDVIVDLINSFNACKRCIKTIEIIKEEPDDLNIDELNLWYFVKLNPLPSRTVLNKQLPDMCQIDRYFNRGSLWMCDLNYYHKYQDWFNELWKPKTVKLDVNYTMINILRIMFSINGKKYKLEHPKVFDTEFFRDNVYHYLIRLTTIRD